MRKGDYKLVYYWDTRESFLYDLSTDLRAAEALIMRAMEHDRPP